MTEPVTDEQLDAVAEGLRFFRGEARSAADVLLRIVKELQRRRAQDREAINDILDDIGRKCGATPEKP